MNEEIKKAKESLKVIRFYVGACGKQTLEDFSKVEIALNQAEENEQQNKILKEELNDVNDFRTHYKSYQEKLANNLKVINCMQEEETTNYNLIEQLEDRNDRLVERLEKQKAELNDLQEFVKIISDFTDIRKDEVEINFDINKCKEDIREFDLVKKVVEKYGK